MSQPRRSRREARSSSRLGRGAFPPVTVRPANEATWDDLRAIFGTRGGDGSPYQCQCQRFKLVPRAGEWGNAAPPVLDRLARLREQTQCGNPGAPATSGIVGYLDGEPVGWCAVEPRSHYTRLGRVPWAGRSENRTDHTIWAVTCFIVRAGFRRRGISYALARAAVDFAWARGARVLEGYPMDPEPGREVIWGDLHVGSYSIVAAAGFIEVGRPTRRRVVMRIEF